MMTPLHLVLPGLCTPVGLKKIRDYLFSDLMRNKKRTVQV
ncbi:hypothetical protein MKleb_5894 (plasmid) [Klebsiella sp. PL-2018]|nr:hypothetical protein MKleb_5820 [Klebsiella sp. PL-2018]QXD01395.1 hypothetical protein MKleb_5894 [Klebsiella sp. PL-2018]